MPSRVLRRPRREPRLHRHTRNALAEASEESRRKLHPDAPTARCAGCDTRRTPAVDYVLSRPSVPTHSIVEDSTELHTHLPAERCDRAVASDRRLRKIGAQECTE